MYYIYLRVRLNKTFKRYLNVYKTDKVVYLIFENLKRESTF